MFFSCAGILFPTGISKRFHCSCPPAGCASSCVYQPPQLPPPLPGWSHSQILKHMREEASQSRGSGPAMQSLGLTTKSEKVKERMKESESLPLLGGNTKSLWKQRIEQSVIVGHSCVIVCIVVCIVVIISLLQSQATKLKRVFFNVCVCSVASLNFHQHCLAKTIRSPLSTQRSKHF